MFRRFEFRRICLAKLSHVPGEFDHCTLHAETNAEKRNLVFPNVLDRFDLPFDPARTESRSNEQSGNSLHVLFRTVLLNFLRIDPHELNPRVVSGSGMDERFGDALVGVVQLNILSTEPDTNG